MTLADERLSDRLSAATGCTASSGSWVPDRLPTISVAVGRSACACFRAHRNQTPHSSEPGHERGMQRTFTSGITTQPSRCAIARIVGIHISAWESPKTTSVLRPLGSPSRQTLLVVS